VHSVPVPSRKFVRIYNKLHLTGKPRFIVINSNSFPAGTGTGSAHERLRATVFMS
jgi:hypothetical protein